MTCIVEGDLMKKLISISVLSFVLVSCNNSIEEEVSPGTTSLDGSPEVVSTNDDSRTVIEGSQNHSNDSSELSTLAYTFSTNIDFFNVSSTDQQKFENALELIKEVVATEEFRDAVLNHTYQGSKTFVDNNGLTNSQIYQVILDGAETLQPRKNNQMDMEVELYYELSSTVGYTYTSSKRIWVNKKYFYTNTVGGVAANLMHEWLHKLGFTHDRIYSVSRDYSVPYAVGRIISSIGSRL